MNDKIGLIVKSKIDIFPETRPGEPVSKGMKGIVYSILQENFNINDECWYIIFQNGEPHTFNNIEREAYLDITATKIKSSYRTKLHSKKLKDIIEDVKSKRIKL